MGFMKDGNYFFSEKEYREYKNSEKSKRRNKWQALPDDEKRKRTLYTICQTVTFIFAAYGVYKLPNEIFSYLGWNSFGANIISLILFLLVGTHLMLTAPAARLKKSNCLRKSHANEEDMKE